MRAQGLVNAILTPLRQLDPESGAYGNEVRKSQHLMLLLTARRARADHVCF